MDNVTYEISPCNRMGRRIEVRNDDRCIKHDRQLKDVEIALITKGTN